MVLVLVSDARHLTRILQWVCVKSTENILNLVINGASLEHLGYQMGGAFPHVPWLKSQIKIKIMRFFFIPIKYQLILLRHFTAKLHDIVP